MITILAFLGGLACIGAGFYLRMKEGVSQRDGDEGAWVGFTCIGFLLCFISIVISTRPPV